MIKAADVKVGDRLDLEGDEFADPNRNGLSASGDFDFTFEFASVEGVERETPGCVRIDTDQGSYGFPPDHLIKTPEEEGPTELYQCGICDHWHRATWNGDCREDAERFDNDQVNDFFGNEGTGWIEVPVPGTT